MIRFSTRASLFYCITALLLILGMFLRSIHLEHFQRIQQDEEAWIFSGASLLTEGIPKSWTVFWQTYETYFFEELNGRNQALVKPFLDHPPLFQVFIGSWAVWTGNNGSDPFDWNILRIPMLAVSGLTLFATALYAKELFGRKTALVVLLTFVLLPSHVLSSRIIAAEHLLALFLVVQLWLHVRFVRSKKKTMRLLLVLTGAILSFVAPLVKLSGIAVSLVPVLLYFKQKKFAVSATMLCALLLSVASFILYGVFYNAELFFSILQAHMLRPQTFWYFFTLFGTPDIGYFSLQDALFLLGAFASLLIVLRQQENDKKNTISGITIAWILCMTLFLTIAPIELYGWYKFILFPLVALGGGIFVREFLSGKMQHALLIIPTMLMHWQHISFLVQDPHSWRRALIIFAIIPLLLFFLIPSAQSRWYRFWSLGLITLLFSSVLLWNINVLRGLAN